MVESLDHVVIKVNDLATAELNYSSLLGLIPSWKGTHPIGTQNVLYRLSNTYIELLQLPENLIHSTAEGMDPSFEGPIALALGTQDIDQTAARLKEFGLTTGTIVEGSGQQSEGGIVRQWRNLFLDPTDTRNVRIFVIEHLSEEGALPRGIPAANTHGSVTGLDHVVVLSGDGDESILLYKERLGLDLRLDRTFPQWGMRLIFFRLGGVTIELAEQLGSDKTTRDSIWGLSYQVESVEAARDRLLYGGFEVSEVRDGRRPGTQVITVKSKTHGVATLMLSMNS